MRAARCSAVVVLVLFLAGCGQTHRQSHGRTLYLTERDNHTDLRLKPHQEFVVALSSNPSSGYRWEFAPSSHPTNPIRQVSHRYVAPKTSGPGAAGREIWRFRAADRGGMDLGFFYGRLMPRPRHWSVARRFDVGIVTG